MHKSMLSWLMCCMGEIGLHISMNKQSMVWCLWVSELSSTIMKIHAPAVHDPCIS